MATRSAMIEGAIWRRGAGLHVDYRQLDEWGAEEEKFINQYMRPEWKERGWVIRWCGPTYYDERGADDDEWGFGPVPVVDGIDSWEDGPNRLYYTSEEAMDALYRWFRGEGEDQEDD